MLTGAARLRSIALLGGLFIPPLWPADIEPHLDQQLQTAYDQIYDQQFQAARQTLAEYKSAHPDDPMGPVSDAAMYMLEQFHRLGILEKDFFSGNGKIFTNKPQRPPDPHLAQAF